MSLPINLIVVLSIAILVMVVVAAMFVLYSGQGDKGISDSVAWGNGCNMAKQRGCLVTDFSSATSTSPSPGLYITGYDPNGNDPKDATTGLSSCSQSNLHITGCTDDTLRKACENFQNTGDLTSEVCRKKCCG